MVVNSKIRDSVWLTFTLTIVNFNYVFIQPAPGGNCSLRAACSYLASLIKRETHARLNILSLLCNKIEQCCAAHIVICCFQQY